MLAIVIAKAEERGHAELVRRRLQDRFEVRVVPQLEVIFRLRVGGGEVASFNCPHFYLRRALIEQQGAIRETHYTLYVIGDSDPDLFDLDGDALGDVLAPLYWDGAREDWSALCPRVVSRFQACRGSTDEMRRFLLEGLNVSESALDEAFDESALPPTSSPLPPPARITAASVESGGHLDSVLEQNGQSLGRRIGELFGELKGKVAGRKTGGAFTPSSTPSKQQQTVSPAQKDRGRRGEEEFVRRTSRHGGWEGFVLVKDVTKENCGYDFDCRQGVGSVCVEVKTFAEDGRIVVSPNELQAAAALGNSYYLVGFLDKGLEASWVSAIIQNPFARLIQRGRFDLDVVLAIQPNDLFDTSIL